MHFSPTWRVAAGSLAAALLVAGLTLGTLQLLRPNVDMGPIAASGRPGQLPEVTSVRVGPQTTELKLASIGSVLLEGPSDFELVGPMRARLTRGKIKFRVTDVRGRGFVVETPYGDVTDLGTEFGLDVSEEATTTLVVFEGEVDLRVSQGTYRHMSADKVERLVGGEGVIINSLGEIDRIMSIFTGQDTTFARDAMGRGDRPAVITHVRDNLRSSETRQYYEIVRGGMQEDAIAYVDRPAHSWNGLTSAGLPSYLLGADYIKPFNNDKMRTSLELEVTLAVPAHLYLFFDDRIDPPAWLLEEFEDTGDDIGIDMGPWRDRRGRLLNNVTGVGPGESIDNSISVWRRKSTEPGIVVLGPNSGASNLTAMYGICAKEVEGAEPGEL